MTLVSKFFLLAAVCLTIGCGGPEDRIKEREKALSSPTPTPGERDIGGSYQVTGSAAGGLDGYTGAISVEPQGDLYSFRWTLSKGTRVGTAVEYGNNAAAAFAPTGEGKGCGVMLYKIGQGNVLSGRSAVFGDTKFAIENATQNEGKTF